MTSQPLNKDQLAVFQRALAELKRLRTRVEELERRRNEPIAVIGLGCRFPGGADDPDSYWRLLHEGRDAMKEVPADRWDVDAYYDPRPDQPGKMYVRRAGFLERVDGFDPRFFGIAPREAVGMDPQQRLLLEVSWEALEHAGIAPDSLRGSPTGVFIGMMTSDYALLIRELDAHSVSGSSFSVAAGRLSYFLGLQGLSMALDTACSSSLVAVHLACQSLRQGESNLALAGGVNLILSPLTSIVECQAHMLAPDGRCKTFDAAADGFARGEGCGMVVLKRLSDARADGDPVLAVICGSAANQDGRSGGLTAPNGPAQEAVLRAALTAAGVAGVDIGYVEAHGTGTALGDPIELQALANVLTPGRSPERPLVVGAVKTNFGHLEAAAGVAGLIKAVLALQHAEIPPHLHLKQLNPHIALEGLPIVIPKAPLPWPRWDTPRRVGVSSFGFSGTNAHVVLEEAPPPVTTTPTKSDRPLQLLCLSARDETALRALAARYAERLAEESAAGLADCAFTAYRGRAQFVERLAIIAADGPQARTLLEAAARGERPAGVWRGQAEPGRRNATASLSKLSPTADWPERLAELAERYLRGEAIDWTSLDAPDSRRRVHLPTYPFQRQRYWVESAQVPTIPGLPSPAQGTSVGPSPVAPGSDPTAEAWREHLYEIDWQLQPVAPARSDTPRPISIPDIAAALEAEWLPMSDEPGAGAYRTLEADLEELCGAYAWETLHRLGVDPVRGDRLRLDGLMAQGAVLPKYRRLLARLLEMLVEDGRLRQFEDTWEVVAPGPVDTAALQARLQTRYPTSDVELALLARCGPRLADILCGRANPLELLFADDDHLAERLYRESPFSRAANQLLQQAVRSACAALPPGQAIQVLEVGGGTGGATAAVLAALPEGRSAYVFSDLSPHFVTDAARTFREQPFVSCRVLDVEQPLSKQGLAEGSFDVVIAANVLHATRDIRRALDHVRAVLAPGGVLLLLEGTGRQRWVDLVFGLTDGWWHFTDTDLRPDYPLLSRRQWRDVLAERGFPDSVAIPNDRADSPSRFAVIVAQATAPIATSAPQTTDSWVVFADEVVGRELALQLRAAGARCRVVLPGDVYEDHDDEVRLHPFRPEDYQRLCATLQEDGCPNGNRVVYLWGLRSPALPAAGPLTNRVFGGEAVVHLLQACARTGGCRLWLVTRGVQPILTGPAAAALGQAPLWGLGRVLALEHPDLWGGLIDLATVPDPDEARQLREEITGPGGEDQVAFRDSRRYVARLVRARQRDRRPVPIRADGTYLITGGLGMLGLRLARWLTEQGARHLVLTGRRGLQDEQRSAVRELEQLGAEVRVVRADVSADGRMAELLDELAAHPAPLRGVIHAAGVASAEPLRELTAEQFAVPLRPKADGAWVLHERTRGLNFDFFVLCSSAASVWGSLGLGAYAAANAFLDTLAHHRRSLGLPALSINWGRFAEAGMVTAERDQFFSRVGLEQMSFVDVLAVLEHLLATGAVQETAAVVHWDRFKPLFQAKARRPFLDDLGAPDVTTARRPTGEVVRRLRDLGPTEGRELVSGIVRDETAALLGLAPDQVHPQQGFFDLGMDSLVALDLKKRLEERLECPVPSTLLFEYASVDALAGHLSRTLLAPAATPPAAPRAVGPVAVQALAAVEQLSEQEVDRLFAERAGRKE